MELTARILNDSAVVQRASATVDVIPQVERVQNLYHELPIYARLRSTGDRTGIRQQVELFGSGSLTESRRDKLEFLFRSPETQTASVLGIRDEYRLQYRSPNVEVQVGDWNYSLSQLTELSRYAAGASARFRLKNFQVGGFYNQNRYAGPKQQEIAGFLRYQFPGEHQVGVNYLKKNEGIESDIATLHGIVRPWKESEVEAEYGMSSAGNGKGQAYALRANGRATWLSYDLRYVAADPMYTGYYRDLNLKSLSVNLFPWENLRLEGYFRDERRNLNRDTLHFYAPRDQYQQVGIGYSSYVSLYFRSSRQEDLFPTSKYRRQQQTAQLHLGYGLSGASVYLDVDMGTTQDLLMGKRFPYRRYALFTSLNPSGSQTYTVSLEHAEENNLYSDEKQERYSAGLTSWVMLGGSTQLQLNLFGSRVLSTVNQTYGFLDVTLDHLFPFGHRIVVKGRQNYSRPVLDARERAYAVEYSVPIGVPLHRIASLGQLRGRIVDDRGVGMRNVLLNAGAFVAVTDADGNYLFPSLPPGTYFVVVDPSSIGLDRVTLRPMPVEVAVRGAAEERLDIGVVKSGRITGTVRSFDFADEGITDTTQTRLTDAGGRQGMILELTNGAEVQRRITDAQGRFLFADLRPGRWMLRVAGGDVSAQHYVERESLELDVQPGSEQQVTLRILPRRRTLRIIQEGAVVQEAQPVTRVRPSQPPAQTPPLPCLVSFDSEKKGFVLQVSSWETEQKAQQAARSAEQISGYSATIERVDAPQTGIRYSVFLGVFKSSQEAEAVCQKLRMQPMR
jgi:cell division protein FtsN